MTEQRQRCKRGPKPKKRDGWRAYLAWCEIDCECRKCQNW